MVTVTASFPITPSRLAMGYPSNVWGAKMEPISKDVFQPKPNNRPTNRPPARDDTKINNPKPRERCRVLRNLARSISRAITNIRYIFPISANSSMVSVSASSIPRTLLPSTIPANNSPTSPGSLRRSNRLGRVSTTISKMVRDMKGLWSERAEP